MKQLLSFFIALIFLLTIFFPWTTYGSEQNYFVVTAYYSPLPDQEYYSMGNYEAEVILNGQWIAGASGRSVFSWMLAAPGGYSFGTKIYLEWLGVWSVEDRGWAIVPAGERGYKHDRIDVWMGYGDEGLRRAMYWGKRTIPGYIVQRNTNVTLNYHTIAAPSWAVKGFKKQDYTPKAVKLPSIFETSISAESNTKLITKLQSVLSELGYLDTDYASGEYDDTTKSAVLDFQLETWVVPSKDVLGATMYGPMTRKQLQIHYDAHLAEKVAREVFFTKLSELETESQEIAKTKVEELGIPKYWDISPEVRELQKAFSTLWYFKYKDTAIFWVKTKNSIIEYQIAKKLITVPTDIWAGTFGPKTRAAFTEDISKIYFTELIDTNEIREDYNTYMKVSSEDIQDDSISLQDVSLSA